MASRATANDTVYAWTNHYNVTRAYVSNGLNQYTASGPRTLSYDANGNLTSDNIWTYGYDVENRLVSAAGPQAVTLQYDAQGRLYKTIGAATTQFLYDGDALVGEYSGTGTLLRRYVHGPGVDEPVLWYEGTGSATRRFFHADAQGSVVAVSDATGLTTEIHSYGPWGEPEGTTGSRFRYTGQIILPELGLYHYKARAYSPWLGRFLQTDPIGYDDDNNLYAYTGNDPVNRMDPAGDRWVSVYIWHASLGDRSVGHVMVTEFRSNHVLLSQFPQPKGFSGTNKKLDYDETFDREGRSADKLFHVWVNDDGAFDAAVNDHATRQSWDWLPDGRSETHCTRAAYNCLKSGGVHLEGQDSGQVLPDTLSKNLDDLADKANQNVFDGNPDDNPVGPQSFPKVNKSFNSPQRGKSSFCWMRPQAMACRDE